MHYLHHNFYHNFTSSVQGGESDLTRDIFVNELSDFIVYDTAKLIGAMKKTGIEVSGSDTDEKIIEIISNNLGSNQNFANVLAFIIAEANQLINNGTTTKEEANQIIKELASGLLIVGKDIRTEEGQAKFKEEVLEQIYAKVKTKGSYSRFTTESDTTFGKNIGYIVLGFVGAIVLTIFIAYRVQRKSLSASMEIPVIPTTTTTTPDVNLGTGGIVPTPVVTPIVTPPVAPITPPITTIAPVPPITVDTPING